MTEAAREQRVTWPYTSFKTLTNLFERLEEDQAIPPKIDRSFLGGSEGQKTQVLAALKFLELIGDDGEVKPAFQQIVGSGKERPKFIRALLAEHYPEATRLAGVHATTQQLQDTFAPLGGDTLRKAMTFYIHAAKYANHPGGSVQPPPPAKQPESHTPGAGNGGGAGGGAGGGDDGSGIDPAIMGLLRRLPAAGTALSSKRRKALIDAFTHTVGFLYPEADEE